MRRTVLVVAAAVLAASSVPADAASYSANLSGFEEAMPVLSNGEGSLRLDVDARHQTVNYTLVYSGLTSNVLQVAIHFGKRQGVGGTLVFLCGPVAIAPACPIAGGTVNGVIAPAAILAIPNQNVPAGDFEALVLAIVSGTAYANVQTVNFPSGEIRGPITGVNGQNAQ